MIQIRKATPSDAETVAALEAQSFSHAIKADKLAVNLSMDIYFYFLAENEAGEAVGYVGGMIFAGEAEIMNIAVLPPYRRQGIARSLMERYIQEAKAGKADMLFLEVRVSNAPAQTLYRFFGFTETGVRKNYYTKPVEDAILMAKELG